MSRMLFKHILPVLHDFLRLFLTLSASDYRKVVFWHTTYCQIEKIGLYHILELTLGVDLTMAEVHLCQQESKVD